MKKVVSTYAIATPCAVTDMKYCPGVPTCAPNGLRTHICQVPRRHATAKAANATQKCARQSRSTLRTGSPPVLSRSEFVFRYHLHGSPHLAVAKAAILVTRHQQIAGPGERGMYLGDEARHYHRIHVGTGNQDAVNDVRRRETKCDAPPLRNREAAGDEHELRCDNPHRDAAVRADSSPEILLCELTGQMQCLGIDTFDIARRVDVSRQGGEYDHGQGGGDQHADAQGP